MAFLTPRFLFILAPMLSLASSLPFLFLIFLAPTFLGLIPSQPPFLFFFLAPTFLGLISSQPPFLFFFWLQHWTLNIRLARPHFPSLPLSLFSSYFWLQHFLVWFGVAGAPFSLFFYLFTFFIPSLVSFFSSLFFSLSFSSLFFSLPFSSLFFSLSFSSFHFLLFCFFWLLNFFWLGAALPKYTEFPGLAVSYFNFSTFFLQHRVGRPLDTDCESGRSLPARPWLRCPCWWASFPSSLASSSSSSSSPLLESPFTRARSTSCGR